MPQALLPMIPDGATRINDLISVVRRDQQWTYFCGSVTGDPALNRVEKEEA